MVSKQNKTNNGIYLDGNHEYQNDCKLHRQSISPCSSSGRILFNFYINIIVVICRKILYCRQKCLLFYNGSRGGLGETPSEQNTHFYSAILFLSIILYEGDCPKNVIFWLDHAFLRLPFGTVIIIEVCFPVPLFLLRYSFIAYYYFFLQFSCSSPL